MTQSPIPPVETEPSTRERAPASPPASSGVPAARPGLSRRAVLARAAAASGALAAVHMPVQRARAQEPPPPAPRAMRSPARAIFPAMTAAPELPPLEVIALNRMGFGHRPPDLAAFRALGADGDTRLRAYVEQQVNPSSIDDSTFEARLAAQGFTTLGKSRTQLWAQHVAADGVSWQVRMQPATETMVATFLRAIYSKRQLVEVLADFWHNHFNVYGWDSWSAGTWVHYDRDVIRANLLGNFRTMLGAVAHSPAMLYYLDNISNTSEGPNENYARELFELHALGAENYLGVESIVDDQGHYRHPAPVGPGGFPSMYVDEDVYGATQCFTGWRIADDGNFVFEDSVHAKYSKTVLARTLPSGSGAADGETVLDILASHPGTARYISRKLCRRLIADNPPERVVQEAADVFYAQRAAPDQLRKVVRTILLSPEFRTTWGEKIKRPFEYVVSLLRAANADFAWSDSFGWIYESMGQGLFDWRPPNGYPDRKENWSSTMPMLQRWRVCNYLVDRWTYGGDGPNKDDLRIDFLAQMPADRKTPNAIVLWWAQRLLGRPLPPAEFAPIVEFMAGGRNPESDLPPDQIADRLRFMCGLIYQSPSFQYR